MVEVVKVVLMVSDVRMVLVDRRGSEGKEVSDERRGSGGGSWKVRETTGCVEGISLVQKREARHRAGGTTRL